MKELHKNLTKKTQKQKQYAAKNNLKTTPPRRDSKDKYKPVITLLARIFPTRRIKNILIKSGQNIDLLDSLNLSLTSLYKYATTIW